MAVQVCPALGEVASPDVIENPALAGTEALRRLQEFADVALPERHRNNDLTVQWAWSNHGVRAVAMLAVALEHAHVQHPGRYFGKLALSPPGPALDLRVNLRRILADRGIPATVAPAPAGPSPAPVPNRVTAPTGAVDPAWLAIRRELKARLRTGAFGSWFPQVGYHGISDGVLSLSAPATAADRIRGDLRQDVLAAARAAGFAVTRLSVTARRTAPPPG